MVRNFLLSLIAIVGGGVLLASAQSKQVTGTVANTDNRPIAGATVLVEGTTVGTTTDANGRFSISAPADGTLKDGTLKISFIGYQTQTVSVAGKTQINVSLQEDTQAIDDVIVVAYGTAKKESFTGSAAVIKSENLEKRVVSNVTKALDGQVAGVISTSGSGQPGSESTIAIRGFGSINASSSPLYVVDGIAYSGSISAINPDDIESITVLKDASAGALYGARGANGVIVINTKRGREGDVEVNFKATLGVSSRAIPNYDLVNQREFIELNWQSLYNSAYFTSGYTDAAARAYASSRLGGTLGTNYNPFKNYSWETLVDPATGKVRADAQSAWDESWIDEVTDNAAFRQEYQASVSGGNNIHRGSMSLSFLDEDGVLKTTKFQRYTGRVSYDTSPKHWFKGGMNVNFAHTKSNTNRYSGSSNSNVFYTAQLMAPIYPVYMKDENGNNLLDENGKKQFDYGTTRPQDSNSNVIAGFYDDPTTNTLESLSARTYLTFGSDDERAGVLQGLKGTINFGVDYSISNNMQYFNREHGNQASNGGLIYKFNYRYMTYTFNQLITYDRTFAERHEVSALLGHEYYSYEQNYLEASRSGLVEGIYEVVGATINSASSSTQDHAIESYFARLNYGFDHKYYIDASWRTDGSSRFAPDTRWGHFWSVGASWCISQEKFMENLRWINIARLRMSYGITGSQNFASYLSIRSYQDFGGISTQNWYGVYLMAYGNPDLQWQKTSQYNFGLDLELLNRRLTFSIDVYNKITNDLLADVNMPISGGFESYKANVGKVQNRGYELSASAQLIRDVERDLRWTVGVKMAHNENQVKEISNSLENLNEDLLNQDSYNPSFIYREGESMNTIYAVPSKGIDPSTGREIFVKRDGTETFEWDAADQVPCGVAEPKIQGTLNSNIRWRGITFNMVFGYRWGGKSYNSTLASKVENIAPYDNADRRVLYDRWSQPGDVALYKGVQDMTETRPTSRFVFKDNAFYCSSLNVGYEFPTEWTQRNLGISYLALNGYLEDLFYKSTIKRERGTDYPFSRKFSLSLTVRF